MAAVAPVAETADLMQKLKLDANNKTHDRPEATKKSSGIQHGSVDIKEVQGSTNQPERSLTPLLQQYFNTSMSYSPNGYPSAYYVGACGGSAYEGEEYTRYVNPDGVEMPTHGFYGDLYHQGYGYPYVPYASPGSPVPTMGHDAHLYGSQNYQYPTEYYQPPAPPSASYTPLQAPSSQGEVSTSAAANQPPFPIDKAKAQSNGIITLNANGISGAKPKPSHQNSSLTSNGLYARGGLSGGHISYGYQDPRFSFDGRQSPNLWYDGSVLSGGHRPATNSSLSSTVSQFSNSTAQNQNLRPFPHLMGLHASRPTSGIGTAVPGIMNRMYPNNQMYTQYGNAFRTGLGYGSYFYDSRTNERWGALDNKYKPRGRGNGFYGYGNENLDGLSELNRGPRAGRFKNQKGVGHTVTIAVKGQNLSANGYIEDRSIVPDRDQFNRTDFPEKYSDAKFFVIKSYSEDDVHKSIKYCAWASTPNGNKKLDAAYQEAQETISDCPVFLFFSVNTSGQFIGVAEMVGAVDFNKTVDYWQQDKWIGCFPVKWHIVKDVPNNILKPIILENNDNKPVTNSRDTQEVKLEQGLQMLKLFKENISKTSILDDFGFYETREKVMQEKRAKQQQLQKQVLDTKPTNTIDEKDEDGANTKPRLQMPLELVTVLRKETSQDGGVGERKQPSEESGIAVAAGDVSKAAIPVSDKCIIANGVTNGC